MRITIVMLFVAVLQTFAVESYSQTANVNVKAGQMKLTDLFSQIEEQTEFLFFYVDAEVKDLDVKMSSRSSKIDEVLSIALKGTNLTYIINDRNVNIVKRSSPQQENKVITGVITDQNGEPIIGANVVVKGTTNGTITDIDGRYSINAGPADVLTITYIGYNRQEISVGGQTNINIQLQEDTQTLDEVVVVGYGTQKKTNLTGSVVSIDMGQMTKRQVAQTSMALQGAVPGLTVNQTSGQPGDDGGTMRIRGVTTLNNQDPYILVDGVEMPLNNIDPSMIESISVLKDAAAAAIYGSRAANGVILVKTKRADQDSFSAAYSGYAGWQSATSVPKKVNAMDHMRLLNVANTNAGISSNFTEEYIREYEQKSLTDPDNYPNTDWLNELMTGSGFMQNHQVTLSGGTKKVKAIASLGYFNQKGIIENIDYKRYTLRLNTDFTITDKLSAQIDALLNMNEREQPARIGTSAFFWALRIPATQQSVLSNGQWGQGWNGDNPVAFTRDGGLEKKEDPSAILNVGLTYKPASWLTLQGNYNANYGQNFRSTFTKAITSYHPDGNIAYVSPTQSSLVEYVQKGLTNLLTMTATASKTFGNHGLAMLVGFEQKDTDYTRITATRTDYVYPDYPVLNAGSTEGQLNTGTAGELALRSYFGRLNYDFAGKYLFEANLRYDGTSRFSPAKRWGVFPSFSAGWRLSEEAFMEDFKGVLSNLKIRGSWGQLGNQAVESYYPYFQSVNLTIPYIFDNVSTSGAGITTMANKELVWETTTMAGVGVDVTLWNKFNITADYYKRDTKDILYSIDIPLSTGVNKPIQNFAEVENMGWDLDLSYTDKVGDVGFRVAFNLSDVKNKVTKGNGPLSLEIIKEGYPINSIYGLEAIGYIQPEDYDENGNYLYASQYKGFGPGDIKYKDQLTVDTDGDGIADAGDGVINDEDKVVIGNQIPRFTYGFSLAADYKGFDFNMLIQGVGKRDGYLYGQGIMPFYVGGTAMEIHKDYWTEDNRNAAFPRMYFSSTNNTQHSSFWLKNAAYMRLKNIQLGYTLPKSVLKAISIDNVRFYMSGENLLTLDNFWEGYDPEAPIGTGNFYPMCKVVSFGVQVKF